MSTFIPTDYQPVMGYLVNNWQKLNGKTPAVVLNPEALPLDLMAWVWGELQSVMAASNALAAGTGEITKGDFSALIVHRLCPLVEVFEVAMNRLHHDAVEQVGRE